MWDWQETEKVLNIDLFCICAYIKISMHQRIEKEKYITQILTDTSKSYLPLNQWALSIYHQRGGWMSHNENSGKTVILIFSNSF